jgi:HK97 family phage major capsid protein/HK97 family phage prohead protease
MTIRRAHAVLELKAYDDSDDKPRRFRGVATTPSVDRAGDIVEPKGAVFQLPIPLLWQHNHNQPIGWVTNARVTDKGIEIEGEVAKLAAMQGDGPDDTINLRQRLAEAWAMMKSGLVRGLSIGFKPEESSRIEGTYSYRFTKWSWLELSAVTIPMNAEANITTVRSADTAVLRSLASGASKRSGGVVRLDPSPGVAGSNVPTSNATKGHNVNITEQLLAFANKRKSAQDRMDAIMKTAADEGRTLDQSEEEEYDGLATELKSIDSHVTRLKSHEALLVSQARPVEPNTGAPSGSIELRGSGPISVVRNLPKGTAFTRYVMALANSKGNLMQAAHTAKSWKDTPEVELVLRAAVDAGTTSDPAWAGALVQYQDLIGEFIDLLRNATILGRMQNVRRVPFNVRMHRQTAGSTGAFVGEGKPTPVREAAFDSVTLPWAKASAIIVISAELARVSNPAAEGLVRSDLIAGISEFLDKRLIDPAFAGVANVSPASLTNGVTPRNASGSTLAAIDDDVGFLMQQYATANIGLASAVWVMSPALAITLSLLRTNQDTPAFPGMTVNGGTFYGLPAITSNSVSPSGSPGDQHLILVNQNEVFLADDGQMLVDSSMEASLQMSDTPADGSQSLVSLWQNGLMGVKVDRWIYWTKRRAQAVQYIDGAQRYGS